jgi:hypothetical protein
MQKNTGALYTREGQVVVAVYDPKTGDAWFNDQSRGIAGYAKITPDLDPYQAWDEIWHAYSYNKYSIADTCCDTTGTFVRYFDGGKQTTADINIVDRLKD